MCVRNEMLGQWMGERERRNVVGDDVGLTWVWFQWV